MGIQEAMNFGLRCNCSRWQTGEVRQCPDPIAKIFCRKLADDEGMHGCFLGQKQTAEFRILSPKVADPDRSIDQGHRRLALRRRPARKSGMVPPRAARRFAASRAISSRRAL